MIVFPVKTDKENSNISPLFGKAKYFAFYDGETVKIEANPYNKGSMIIDWFLSRGVRIVIIKEMGNTPYKKIKDTDIDILYAGEKKISINDLIEEYNSQKLEVLDEDRMMEIIKNHKKSHKNN
ncbi:NifB/NifX family molybdenum-iron cluster-binding protein [Arcobacter sp. CECT 8989]|uniref:NifB/NifX family molybdenum-iron cluster-binding protein n=1 Tax=Arcobacter sp. CECT 8989 TaxID=2044509 RepID=UPI0013E9304E|nr:NifB/NifX family molybdenum-iron cluster-binding protein [Arcobacter sp. CECT 8989]